MESIILVSSHLLALLIGAGLTLVCSYLFRSDTAGSATAREQAARRLALLEEVALQSARLHHLYQRQAALLLEQAKKPSQNGSSRDGADDPAQALKAALDDLPLADARLLLLGEDKLARVLRLYGNKVARLRRQHGGSHRFSEEELNNHLQEINKLRDKFFQSLSDRYGKKLH